MQYKLIVLSGPENIGKSFPLQEGTHYLGRTNPPCDLTLNGLKVSKRHCSFVLAGEKLTVTDLKSSNGVFVNGQKVNDRVLIAKDRIVVGEFLLEVKVEK